MATYLSSLLDRIQDVSLREAIINETRLLSEGKQFGLVFEKHIPEFVALPDHKVAVGRQVENRTKKDGRSWTVAAIEGSQATISRQDGDEILSETVALVDLVVVQNFNDPIFPGFQVLDTQVSSQQDTNHVVIKGENFYALQTLLYSHREKVDVIYIDPPYNTGNADWIYNDRYVEGSDTFRHSKWLSFMERRLNIAKQLLKPTGIIVVAIDDNEHHYLRMLLDQVMGAQNFLVNISWQGRGKNDRRFTGGGQDYMLAYAKDASNLIADDVRWIETKPGSSEMIAVAQEAYETAISEGWAKAESASFATKALRVHVKENKEFLAGGLQQYNTVDEDGRIFREGPMSSPNFRANLLYDIMHPVTGKPVKKPDKGWTASQETMAEWIANGEVVFGADESKQPNRKLILDVKNEQVPLPSFTADRDAATKHLEDLLGSKRFPFPKNHEVLARWFSIIAKKDAVILDFFAGSGTTAEAVVSLNIQDGGTRQAILITNNELKEKDAARLTKEGFYPGDEKWEAEGIYHHVTMPRVKAALTGLRPDGTKHGEPLPGNAYFLELKHLDPDQVALGKTLDSLSYVLWLKAGARGMPLVINPKLKFCIDSMSNYAILLDASSWRKAAEELAGLSDVSNLFVITDSEAVFQQIASEVGSRYETTMLYEDYLSNFQVNAG